ncbi:hypothetical protein DNTS_025392 [Danionella cerebrum]|uniref:Globin domain-containing protein n=1 Tax=Danionella cerebrum TaxID=2873325 RepID=A0A553QH08_9TELE|nr:hypothetical protein DNTS_025392 [Danionella translucida]
MSLTAKNKKVIKEFFAKVAPKADDIGQEALSRTLFVYPQTKTYFSHWMDLSPSSPQVRKHGSTVMNGVLNAVGLIDDLKGGLLSLSELHAFMLRIDPANFKIFNHNMLVSLAMMFPDDFTPSVHVSVDKFLSQSRDHDGEELLESGLNFRSESSAHLSSHNNVVRVHAQLLGVQHAQIGVGGFDIVHVLHGQLQALHHSFTMSSDHGVPHDSSGIVEVSKLGEVPLGPWVHDETPIEKPLSGIEFMKESEHKPGQSLRTNHLRVKFGEDVLDGGCLEICPHDHVSALDVQLLTQKRKSPLHRSLLQRQLTPTMSLSAKDKAAVKALWAKVAGKADDIGHDALSRMLVVYPQTKTYFSHWKDLTPGSAPVRKHGSTVMGGVAEAVSKIDDLTSGLLNLSELHAYLLRVDPANFKILSHNILVVLATMFPNDFTPEAHVAMDKFLAALALAIDHDGEELLESGLNFRSESSAHLSSHNNVVRVHAQLLGVQHAQIGVGGFDIVHVLHGQLQALHHSFTMSSDHGVPHDSSGIVEVSKLGEVPLGPWVHDETPIEKPLSGIEFMKESEHKPGQSLRTNHLRVKFGEDVLDGGCLEICPHDHVSALDVQLLTQKRKSPNRYRLSMKNMAVGKSTYPLRDYKSLLKSQLYTMSLSAKDKAAVVALWAKISGKADDIGHDALSRMLTVYPQTKTYFSHWTDLTPGSAPVRKHGSTVMAGVAEAVSKIDDLTAGLLNLSELHAFVLRVDPANFKILSHNILVVLATMFPNDFTPEAHVAMDKFLGAVALAMSENHSSNMSLTAKDKAAVVTLWSKIKGKADDIGNDALSRMLIVYPQTKTYFAHWKDLSPGSAPVRKHGSTVMAGVADAVSKIDDLTAGLLSLSELHAFVLRVDPANFKILSHNILVVLATMFPNDFTPEAHVAMDKFLAALALAMSEKYR